MANKKRSRTRPGAPAAAKVDYWRQLDIFSPSRFVTPITVIGAGATGSYVALLLAKMGCGNITVYDFDTVEDYNLPNQVYGLGDVGQLKTAALAARLAADTGISVRGRNQKFERGLLRGIVFVLTDTMASRQHIWETSLRGRRGVNLVIETRMGARGGYVYAVDPNDAGHVASYEATLYPDDETEESACTNRAISPTVATLAGLATNVVVCHANEKPFPNETFISLSPLLIQNKTFLRKGDVNVSNPKSRAAAKPVR